MRTSQPQTGDKVRSHMAAKWTGTVLDTKWKDPSRYAPATLLCLVKPEIDQRGNPITTHCPARWLAAAWPEILERP